MAATYWSLSICLMTSRTLAVRLPGLSAADRTTGLIIKTLVPHVAGYADDLARRWHGVVTAFTLDNDVLAERLCPREVAAGKGLVDDDDRRRVLSVAVVE